MDNLFQNIDLSRYTVKKPRKDSERQELIGRLSEATGWPKKSVYFSTLHFPISWLKDALEYCLHFGDIKARNFKLKEFINLTKEKSTGGIF